MKKLLIFVAIFAICLCGCNSDKTDNTIPSTPDTTNPTTPTDSPYQETLPNDFDDNKTSIEIDKYLWEKEYSDFKLSSLTIDKNWDNEISFGETKMLTRDKNDISFLPNYFYTADQQHIDLETAYHVSHYGIKISTSNVKLSDFASAQGLVTCTTFGQNVIIENICVIANVNPYEGGFEILKNTANTYGENRVGIGNTYSDVNKLLGNALSETSEQMDDITMYTCVYASEHSQVMFSFMSISDDRENAVMTSIEWTPIKIRAQLHTQDNIEYFDGYPGGYNENV